MPIPDITTYAGLVALISFLMDLLKFTKLIKPGEAAKWSATVQTLFGIILWAVGSFMPDLLNWIPVVDDLANDFSGLGVMGIAFVAAAILFANKVHDAFSAVPWLNKVFGKRLTA